MSGVLLAVVLGIIEGVTEFLPISSTAHLRIAQHFLGISLEDEFWKLFAIFIQLGAILSVVVIYRKRLCEFVLELLRIRSFSLKIFQHPLMLIMIAFFCTVIPAFLLSKIIGEHLENLKIIIASLAIGGIAMITIDLYYKKPNSYTMADVTIIKAMWVGFVQVLSAVFPGTSRSMSTIAAGQMVGMSRSLALEFSFFVSIPVMFAATLYDMYKYLKSSPLALSEVLNKEQVLCLAVGFLVSYFVAYLVVRWFLQFVSKHGFIWFGAYRILFALFLFFQIF